MAQTSLLEGTRHEPESVFLVTDGGSHAALRELIWEKYELEIIQSSTIPWGWTVPVGGDPELGPLLRKTILGTQLSHYADSVQRNLVSRQRSIGKLGQDEEGDSDDLFVTLDCPPDRPDPSLVQTCRARFDNGMGTRLRITFLPFTRAEERGSCLRVAAAAMGWRWDTNYAGTLRRLPGPHVSLR